MGSRLPLVVVLGATGSGKTKLSLELARKFGGEIIGADSIQVYKGLDIVTAKATEDERLVAPHHLIDILNPHEACTVVDYRNQALNIVKDLVDRGKLPIVVGGTNYYIESLLWNILIEEGSRGVKAVGVLPNNEHELPSEVLHDKLKELDPAMARRLHPNNKRKILRSLEVLYHKGKRHSDILKEQQSAEHGSGCDGGLRFPNSLVLWLRCDQETLDKRLNDRVDKMLEQGLLEELTTFHRVYNAKRVADEEKPNYTKGIFQSIGLKEFHSYLLLDDEERISETGKKKSAEGVEQLKMATRRYARTQNKWVRNRFLGRSDRQVPPVYGLDTTDVSLWEKNVSQPAEDIVRSYVSKTKCDYEPMPVQYVHSTSNSADDTYTCEVCERVFVGDFQWKTHIKSNKHKRRLESRNRKRRME